MIQKILYSESHSQARIEFISFCLVALEFSETEMKKKTIQAVGLYIFTRSQF